MPATKSSGTNISFPPRIKYGVNSSGSPETAVKSGAKYLVTRDEDIKRDPKLVEEMERYDVKVIPVSQFLDMLSQSA